MTRQRSFWTNLKQNSSVSEKFRIFNALFVFQLLITLNRRQKKFDEDGFYILLRYKQSNCFWSSYFWNLSTILKGINQKLKSLKVYLTLNNRGMTLGGRDVYVLIEWDHAWFKQICSYGGIIRLIRTFAYLWKLPTN